MVRCPGVNEAQTARGSAPTSRLLSVYAITPFLELGGLVGDFAQLNRT